MGKMTDQEKILLFLELEKVAPGEVAGLTGPIAVLPKKTAEQAKKNFIPYLKEKLIWS